MELLKVINEIITRAKDFRECAQEMGKWDKEYIQRHHEKILKEAEFYIALARKVGARI